MWNTLSSELGFESVPADFLNFDTPPSSEVSREGKRPANRFKHRLYFVQKSHQMSKQSKQPSFNSKINRYLFLPWHSCQPLKKKYK